MKNIILWVAMATFTLHTAAQTLEKKDFLYSHRFSILAGMIQPIALKGGNVEVNYYTNRVSFGYSHGFSLDPPAVGAYKDQNLVLHLPYSSGFGVGYRFNSFLDIRFEPKLHAWEVFNKGDKQVTANKIADYKTFTLGVGLYYRYFPFKNSDNKWLQGITTSTSIRWWQNVGTTLSNDQLTYLNKGSGENKTVKASNIGIANTPLVVNIAIGYTFGGK